MNLKNVLWFKCNNYVNIFIYPYMYSLDIYGHLYVQQYKL